MSFIITGWIGKHDLSRLTTTTCCMIGGQKEVQGNIVFHIMGSYSFPRADDTGSKLLRCNDIKSQKKESQSQWPLTSCKRT